MTLCSSGSLSILGTAGTNRSIACEVDGDVTPPKTLCTLSESAGKSAPHSMLEFYGYSSIGVVSLDITQDVDLAYTQGYYGVVLPTGTTSGCYCMCVNMLVVLGIEGTKCSAHACVIRNGTCIGGVSSTVTGTTCKCNMSFVQDYNDNTCLCIRAANFNGIATSRACITSVTCIPGCGDYCLGTPACMVATVST